IRAHLSIVPSHIGPDQQVWKVVVEGLPAIGDQGCVPLQTLLAYKRPGFDSPVQLDESNAEWITTQRARLESGYGNILVKVPMKMQRDLLLKRGIRFMGQELKVRRFSDHSRRLQCTRCRAWGHPTRGCSADRVCVRCGQAPHQGVC